DEKPLKGILTSLDFSVRGYDHRLHDYHVEVVDNPAVINTKLQCEFPAYMVDEQLSQWLPQTRELTSSTQLPTGTRIRILATCNKPLEKVVIVNTETQEQAVLEIAGGGTQFEYDVPSLMGNLSLDVTLFDTDGVMTDKPHRIYIVAIEDQPPQVDVVLRGIGTAVTPDVLIPAQGKVEDDYAVAETWFEAVVDDADPVVFPAPLQAAGKFDSQLDFRQQRSQEGGLQLNVGQKLVLGVKASDKFDLGGASPNLGAGDTYQLEVVSPDQLLALLERRELGLRQRFEQIIDEVTAMRDSLVRVQTDLRGGAKLSEGEPEAGDAARDPQADAQRARSLRVLWTQRALIQSQKSAQEVLGVAGSFNDIREELINNRVDSEDRKLRLQEQISTPLQQIGQTMFPDLDRLLQDLETNLDDAGQGPPAADLVVEQADDILDELDKVLQKMLELETFNELVDIVRDLLEQQQKLIEDTEKEQKRQVLELLK
ncbi:MAG: hypothetical protein J5I93_14755, partial [Pirellulaceae bacterium]|nr:hypothetical protein [Pirellulaceae bacterium]